MNNKKNEAWHQITKEFNSSSGGSHRSLQILKNKYINVKKQKRVKKFSDEKKITYGTGGGPPTISQDSEIDNTVREIIGSRMTGFTSQFDSDVTGTFNNY